MIFCPNYGPIFRVPNGSPTHVRKFVVFLFFSFATIGNALAGEPNSESAPKLTLRPPTTPVIGLKFSPEMPIETRQTGDAVQTFVHLQGEYPIENSSLLAGLSRGKISEDGHFDLPVLVTGATTHFDIRSVDGYGVTQKESYEIDFPNYRTFNAKSEEKRENENGGIPKPLSVALGVTSISYTETEVANYSSTALTLKANYFRPTPFKRWNIGVGGFFTLLPIQESAPASARFLGVNLRLGYSLIANPTVWRIGIYGGFYLTTMYVKNDQFGFNDISGPQIFPVVRRIFSGGRSASAYLKYAALVSNASVVSLKSREIAAGGEYVFDYHGGNSRSVQLDFSSLNVVFPSQAISVKTITISSSYCL
jgi:hypothetical protein